MAFIRNNSTTQHDQIYKRLLSEPITASTNHKAQMKTVFRWRKWTDPIICANYSVVLYIVVIVSSGYIGFTWMPILYRVVSPARWKVHDLFQRRWCEFDWYHDDVIKWKQFPLYWPSVSGIHRRLVDSPRKVKWRGAFMFSLISAWTNGWANNRRAGDLRRHRAHYDVNVMMCKTDL